jgi:hypothetical protein
MAEYNYVGDGSPDGTIVVKSTTEKLGFYGTTPVTQPTSANQAAVSTAAITTVVTTAITTAAGIYGFTTAAQGLALATAINSLITQVAANVVLVNQMRSDLVTLGILKGS